MYQSERLGEIYIEAKSTGDMARDLCDFHGVREAAAKVVRGAAGEDLSFAGKAAEGARLNDAVAVTLKGSAAIALWRRKDARRKLALVFTEDTTGVQVVSHSV